MSWVQKYFKGDWELALDYIALCTQGLDIIEEFHYGETYYWWYLTYEKA
jgi:hypothetical protein